MNTQTLYTLTAVCCLDSVQEGFTALIAAAQEGHLKVVEMLLEANAEVNIMSNVRTTIHKLLQSLHDQLNRVLKMHAHNKAVAYWCKCMYLHVC